LPARIGDLAKFIGRFRKTIHSRIPEMPLRRRFWERVIDGQIGALVLSGQKDEAEAALNGISDPSAFASADASGQPQGSVIWVGAGPGDADLLTVKALRTLQDADIVFHDEGLSGEILDRIRRDASRVTVAKQDVQALMIEAAQAGQRVVRLVGGDGVAPASDEIVALRDAGVTSFIVPGVAADVAAVRPKSSSAARTQIARPDAATSSVN
jgi:uroporphyrin-III C-methyltransferase / precorrin-2 dehydrogenase / sirohydrochlorin ferrochelatase